MTKKKDQNIEYITEAKGALNYTGDEKLGPMKHNMKGKRLCDRTPEEIREATSRAGIQKGINCARRRSMREWAKALGDEQIVNKLGEAMARNGVVILQQYNKAMKGDTQAAKFLADLMGELIHNELPKIDQTITLKID